MLNRRSQLTLEDVDWVYDLFFGRLSGGLPVLEAWRKQAPDLKSLVAQVVHSEEFQRRLGPARDDVEVSPPAELLSALAHLRPFKVKGLYKRRIGGPNKGGYVMLDDFVGIDLAFSAGLVVQDASWNTAMAAHGASIVAADYDVPPAGSVLLQAMLATVPDHRGAVLRCDVEGAEWDMLSSARPGFLRRFRQIVIDLHFMSNLDNVVFARRALAAIERLTEHHHVVHVHGDNSHGYAIVSGVPLPSALELTLLRIGDGRVFSPSDEIFPTNRDAPSLPSHLDYRLGAFRF